MSVNKCFPQPSLHHAPGSDVGRIHVSSDGLRRILGAPLLCSTHFLIVWSVLPHPPPSSTPDGPHPQMPGSNWPPYLRELFCTQILRRVLRRCNVQHVIPFIQGLTHLASFENDFVCVCVCEWLVFP